MKNTKTTAIAQEIELDDIEADLVPANKEPANANRRQPSSTALALVPDIVSHVKTVDDFDREISAAFHRSLTSIIDVGKKCAEAAIALSRADLKELKSRRMMSDTTFSKYVKIAEDARITDPQNQHCLPNSYGTLYELTFLSDDEFEAAIRGGSINPDMQRTDAVALRPSSDAKSEKSTKPKSAVLLKIVAVDDVSDADFKKLQTLVLELAEEIESIDVEPSARFKSIRDRLNAST